ncbi:MAG: stage II sporulation protein P [Eubacterium sp.]|nr:stage II sporulation protein P [Eubacterium sp.]
MRSVIRQRKKKGKKRIRKKLPFLALLLFVMVATLGLQLNGRRKNRDDAKYYARAFLEKKVNASLFPAIGYHGEDTLAGVLKSLFVNGNTSQIMAKETETVSRLKEAEEGDVATEIESPLSYEQILHEEAHDENEPQTEDTPPEEVKRQEEEVQLSQAKLVEYSYEKLSDFDYLISNFYLVDKTTTIAREQLNAAEMLAKDMHMQKNEDGSMKTSILIYHTHSQEEYADHVEGDVESTVIGVGNYLAALLEEKGFSVIHDTGAYDLEGRSTAYTRAAESLEQILAEHPEIEVIIDLHRDGVAESTHMQTEVNGTVSAPIMFFNGLSHTTSTGDIAYLPNPYIADNLALSFQLQLAAAEYYPGFTRPIYLKGYRYNMHYLPKSLLVEVGAQTNTSEEAKNAMVPLADLLYKVLAE